MYHSTEEIINEVRARMIAGTTKHSTLPPLKLGKIYAHMLTVRHLKNYGRRYLKRGGLHMDENRKLYSKVYKLLVHSKDDLAGKMNYKV